MVAGAEEIDGIGAGVGDIDGEVVPVAGVGPADVEHVEGGFDGFTFPEIGEVLGVGGAHGFGVAELVLYWPLRGLSSPLPWFFLPLTW